MTWGRDTDVQDAAEQLRDFTEAGGTLVDTAGSYAGGAAETILGNLLGTEVPRADVVLCTKGGLRHTPRGTVVDASRRALLGDLEASLTRLGTDCVDIFLVQAPDAHTPFDETLSALRQAVTSGKARYVGLSNHGSWQTGFAAARLSGWGDCELAAIEVEHSLLNRDVEQDIAPAAQILGAGVLAWSALGRGVLTGKYRRALPADSRGASSHMSGFVDQYLDARGSAIVDALCTAAVGLGRAPLEVALAWLLSRPYLASAIIGARIPSQLRESLLGLDLQLPAEVSFALDDVSEPDTRLDDELG